MSFREKSPFEHLLNIQAQLEKTRRQLTKEANDPKNPRWGNVPDFSTVQGPLDYSIFNAKKIQEEQQASPLQKPPEE